MSDELLQPHYAEGFRCIGSDCEETCCQGWGVYVDKATYKKYRATPGLRRAAEHIELDPSARDNFKYARIKFQADNRCPFLTPENLCSIQRQHGAAFLSKTCSRYPRALVRIDGTFQKAMYLSCPEAARLVLLSPRLLPPQDAPRYHDFTLIQPQNQPPPSPAALIRQLRSFTLDLLQDRSYPAWQRLFLLGIVCRRAHELTAARAAPRVPQLLAQYATMILEGSLRPHLDGIPARSGLQLDLVLQLIRRRFQVDQPEPGFAACVVDFLEAIGYAPERPLAEAAARYRDLYLCRYEPFAQAFPHFMENYLLNYVFRTRFPFVDIPHHVQQSIDPLVSYLLLALHYRFLHSLLIGAAARYGDSFSAAHAVRVAHSFGRAVEHNVKFSDELMSCARSPELQQTDGLAVLLRN